MPVLLLKWPKSRPKQLPGTFPDQLPDLSEHLKANGIYDGYLAYRKGYLEWRRGAPSGAQGELTADALEQQALADQNGPSAPKTAHFRHFGHDFRLFPHAFISVLLGLRI